MKYNISLVLMCLKYIPECSRDCVPLIHSIQRFRSIQISACQLNKGWEPIRDVNQLSVDLTRSHFTIFAHAPSEVSAGNKSDALDTALPEGPFPTSEGKVISSLRHTTSIIWDRRREKNKLQYRQRGG